MTDKWLYRALEESRARGFLGPVPIKTQIEHAEGFARVWASLRTTPPASYLDLGSGGGLPGLVLLDFWNEPTTFVDSMIKRTNFLEDVLSWSDAPDNGEVVNGRAEILSREPQLEARFSLVSSRSFGPPAVTAECATRFLEINGLLIVSEPPNDDVIDRWNPAALGQLGLRSEGRFRDGPAFQVIRKIRATPEKYPRDIGVPGKNPLF